MAIDTQTINTLPANNASFVADVQAFLANEDADRFAKTMNPFVVQGGLHGTGASLVGDPGTTEAFPAGYYVLETGTITYPDDTANIWVIIHKDTVTDPGGDWQRVAGTHYLFDPVSSSQPTAPAGSLILMKVVTASGSISTVTDLRNLDAFTTASGQVRCSSDDTTLKYLEDAITVGTGLTKSTTNPAGNEKVQLSSDGKMKVSSDDTTPGFIEDKVTVGDGIARVTNNSGSNENQQLSVDLASTPALEFSSAKLRLKTSPDLGISRAAGGAKLDITGTTEMTGDIDTPRDEIIIHDVSANALRRIDLDVLLPTGMTIPYIGATAPSGWILAQGGTIGNASSGGTARANADTEELFELLWNSMADAEAPVSGGRGASAQADFDADKTITIPDLRGNVPVGKDSGTFGTLGDKGGAETHTLTIAEMPAHTHTKGVATSANAGEGAGSSGENLASNTGSTGGDGAHNNLQPWISLNYIIKL